MVGELGDHLGKSMSIVKETIISGAPGRLPTGGVYVWPENVWLTPSNGKGCGESVAGWLHEKTMYVAIGCPQVSQVVIFKKVGKMWEEMQVMKGRESFGAGLSGRDGILVVGKKVGI